LATSQNSSVVIITAVQSRLRIGHTGFFLLPSNMVYVNRDVSITNFNIIPRFSTGLTSEIDDCRILAEEFLLETLQQKITHIW